MVVYSFLKPRPFVASPSGSAFIEEVILDEAEHKLVKTGFKTDVKAMINSYAVQVDIQRMVKQRDLSGDDSILMRKQGFFVDSRNMPKSQLEVYNSLLNAERIYHNLPADVKKSYKSFNDFCSKADFFSILKKNTVNSDTKENVKSNSIEGKDGNSNES